MAFKKINAWFHLWFGLVSGIIVFILGITGCVLVFEQEIKSLSSPWFHAEKSAGGEFLPPSALYRSVKIAVPQKEVRSVWYHGDGRTAHVSLIKSDSVVFVNPYTAGVVAVLDHEDWVHFFEEGHFYLWLPEKVGHQVVGWGTFVFFFLLISGLILWIPKKWNRKGIDQSFKIRWRARFRRLNYDLHNVLGFYSIIVCIVFAFTGLMMSFAWFNKGVYWVAGGKTRPAAEALSDTTASIKSDMLAQVDKAWYKGMNEISEHYPKNIIVDFPKEVSAPIYVCTDMYRGTWRDVYLDQHSLRELPASNKKLKDEDLASWIRRSNYGLHVGEIGGISTKIIYFLASLICASLPVTGFYIWWNRKKKSSKNRKKIQPVLASS